MSNTSPEKEELTPQELAEWKEILRMLEELKKKHPHDANIERDILSAMRRVRPD